MAVLPYRDYIEASGTPVYYGDAVPTSGTFNQGDILIIVPTSSATPGGSYPMAYRCVSASVANNGGTWAVPGNSSFSSTVIAAAATIAPTSSVFHVSGTAHTVDTITPPAGLAAGGALHIIPDSTWATTTSGNIALASTAVVNKQLIMVYDGTKFYPSY